MKVFEALKFGEKELGSHGVPFAEVESKFILSCLFQTSPLNIYLDYEKPISQKIFEKYKKILKKRTQRIPLPYLIKEVEFYGLRFKVNKDCFIPRQETEVVVETAIKIIKENPSIVNVVDVGTGCGNIAISLAKFVPNINILATDIDSKTLKVAKLNAKIHNIKSITFLKGDILKPVSQFCNYPIYRAGKTYSPIKIDMIISNPPYLNKLDIKNLQPEVSYEPFHTYYGGDDGLYFYRKILDGLPNVLNPGGFVLFEVGYNSCENVINLLKERKSNLKQYRYKIEKDYSGIDRVVWFTPLKWKNM